MSLSTVIATSVTSWAVIAPQLDEVPAAEDVQPGWLYSVMVLALIVVTVVLWLSMRKRLRKINVDREPGDRRDGAEPGANGRPDDPGAGPRQG